MWTSPRLITCKEYRQRHPDAVKVRRIANNTLEAVYADRRDIVLHGHVVVSFTAAGARLDSCGHRSQTTKKRINSALPSGFGVYQKDYAWFVSLPGGSAVPFKDGMIV